MRRSLAACVAMLVAAADVALGATQRAFVSVGGNDANAASNCSLLLPCRSFAAAVGVVSADGEVIALDSGGYGPVIITKGVTIQAPAGVYAGISVLVGSDGVTVNAPAAKVTLRGLSINGQGGDRGIVLNGTGTTLRVERCAIANMQLDGILAFSTASRLHVLDTLIANNGAFGINVNLLEVFEGERLHVARNGNYGIGAANTFVVTLRDATLLENGLWGVGIVGQLGTQVDAAIERVAIHRNGAGGVDVSASSTGAVTVSLADAAFTDNGASQPGNGTVRVQAIAPSKAGASIERSVVQRGFGDAVRVSGTGATATVSNSTLTSNAGYALDNAGGTLYTRQNNTIRGNSGEELANQTSGPISPLSGG